LNSAHIKQTYIYSQGQPYQGQPSMSSLRTQWFFLRKKSSMLRHLKRKVRQTERSATLHDEGSKEIYDAYGERELHQYETGTCRALVNGEIKRLPYTEVRSAYVAPIIAEIERLQAAVDRPVRVLEVGCGNATNLMLLRQHFGDTVELSGIDISANRIDCGRSYWQDRLDGVELQQASATDLSLFADGHFDLSYSICALEQITFRIHEVVSEMKRVSSQRIVCVEPIYEYGNDAQRLYNIVNDQCRTLLQDMRSNELDVEEHGLLSILHNPLNPVGLVVGKKAA